MSSQPKSPLSGDGALQYSVQSLYTAAQLKLEKTPNVPALDVPGLDIVSTAKGFGCFAMHAKTAEEIKEAFTTALRAEGPTVMEIPIAHQLRPLVPSAAD
jgi:benzoylformate decarboxylase